MRIMAEHKVQLKEQEIVGQEVVLSDIYPKTDTSSVEDVTTGIPLDVKLDYLAELINDKLTRVVNSVNGRTGVVVLDADDVGLGKVDNISFAEIQDWIEEIIGQHFKNRRLLLFDTYLDLQNFLDTDPKENDHSPFYVKDWDTTDDHRSYIGYIEYDETNGIMKIGNKRAINTINHWDGSINYTKGTLSARVSALKDNVLTIFKKNEVDKEGEITGNDDYPNPTPGGVPTFSNAGLYVDWDLTGHTTLFFTKPYEYTALGSSASNSANAKVDKNGMFVPEAEKYLRPYAESPNEYKLVDVQLYINGTEIKNTPRMEHPVVVKDEETNATLLPIDTERASYFRMRESYIPKERRKTEFKCNVCVTNSENPNIGVDYLVWFAEEGEVEYNVLQHNPLVGTLEWMGNHRESNTDDTDYYVMNLYTISPGRSWGLQYTNSAAYDQLLSVNCKYRSGIQIIADRYQTECNNNNKITSSIGYPDSNLNRRIAPDGRDIVFYDGTNSQYASSQYSTASNYSNEGYGYTQGNGGLYIETDASMCVYSYKDYGLNDISSTTTHESNKASNWYGSTPYYVNQNTLNEHHGYLNSPSFLGINLVKGVFKDGENRVKFLPMSGLKVIDPHDYNVLPRTKHPSINRDKTIDTRRKGINWVDLGLYADVDSFLNDENYNFEKLKVSGGLMINVGKGLQILPEEIPENGELYNAEGKVSVRLGSGFMFDTYDRITYDPETLQDVSSGATNLQAIALIDKHRKDNTVVNYRMNPSTIAQHRIHSVNKIKLGDGLRIRIDVDDIENIVLNELTINRLPIFMNHVIEYHTIIPASEEGGDPTIESHTIKPSDCFSINSATYNSFVSALHTEVLDVIEQDYDALEELYRHLQEQRDTTDATSASYSNEYVVSSVSLTMLITELVSKTQSGNNIKENWDIPKCLEEYSKLHRNKAIGDYIGDGSDTPTNYGDDIWDHDYLEDNLKLFNDGGLTDSQKFVLNAFINVFKAIRQALTKIGQWGTYTTKTNQFLDNYTGDNAGKESENQITISLKKSDGVASYTYRKDTSGFFGLLLMEMGFNVGGPTKFKTSNLLNDSDHGIIDDNGENVFSYKENKSDMEEEDKLKLGDLQTGDLIVTDNMMWMFGYVTHEMVGSTITKIKIYGLDFSNGSSIEQLSNAINNLESANSSYAAALANLFTVTEIPNIAPISSDKTDVNEIIKDTLDQTIDDAAKLVIRYIGTDTSRAFT